MSKRLLLLEMCPRNDACEFANIWQNTVKEDLVLAAQGNHNGILAVLNEKDDGVEKLADWIENPDQTFDHLPLFIIWDNRPCDSHSMCVHEYAPFENGVRQLVREYKP
jgi:hypothetical protein